MKGDGKEFELKLELDEEGLASLAANPALKQLAIKPSRQRMLKSTYFDTPDHRLHKAGISFRIRDAAGKLTQTVKQGTQVRGGVSNPVEIEAPTSGMIPDPSAITDQAMLAQLRGLADFGTLRPVFSVEVMRTTHQLSLDGAKMELALDHGQLRSPRKVRPICEAELELESGDLEPFLEIATRLFSDIAIRFGTASKAQKGFDLLSRAKAAEPKPANAWRPQIDASQDVAEGFGVICQSTCDQILNNWPGLLSGDDPEFAHQLRIGLRRLRSTLLVFREVVDNATLRSLNEELGHIGRVVGGLRNLDVMIEDIVDPALRKSKPTEESLRLRELVTERCKAERRKVRRTLAQRAWNPLLLRVALLPHGAGWARDAIHGRGIEEHAHSVLEHCWKTVRKRADRLDALSDEKRHRLRKDMKVLRYAIEFFSAILPEEETKNFVRELKSLQDRFGYLNDVALAQTLPEMLGTSETADPKLAETIGYVLGWHQARAELELADAARQWKRLRKQARPWD
ncbi:MAG: CYTH and CHAD domain-containing protein [Nitratireductor sp.]|nr:CYTH and CHAD domain-containing protein [Nitratireductor sp.]